MKIDFHIHTQYSKDTLTSLKYLKKVFDKRGLFPVITDHNNIKGALRFRKEFDRRCIIGEEVKTTEGEVIGLYLNEEIPKGLGIHETIDRIRQQGGIVYLPHPFDKIRHHLKKFDIDADIVEVFNSRVLFHKYNLMAEEFAEKKGWLKATGSDAHFGWHAGLCHVELEEFDGKKELLKNLKNGRLVTRRTPLYAFPLTELVQTYKKIGKRII